MKRNVSIKWKTVLNVKVCLRIFDMNCVAEDITKFGGLTNILIWNKTKLFGADFTDKQNMKKNRTKMPMENTTNSIFFKAFECLQEKIFVPK
jgi:hypothetical protein